MWRKNRRHKINYLHMLNMSLHNCIASEISEPYLGWSKILKSFFYYYLLFTLASRATQRSLTFPNLVSASSAILRRSLIPPGLETIKMVIISQPAFQIFDNDVLNNIFLGCNFWIYRNSFFLKIVQIDIWHGTQNCDWVVSDLRVLRK